MRKINLAKLLVVISLVIGFVGFYVSSKPIMDDNVSGSTATEVDENFDIKDYKKWVKANEKPEYMPPRVSAMCARPTQQMIDDEAKNPHIKKYINVYVNNIGKNEMLTKKNPKFPVGTIVVKEKLDSLNSKEPSLLTVMIKRKEGFNPKVGDWEFMTLNGNASEITSRGKLESCQNCHLRYPQNDFITRTYLPDKIRQKLK